MKVPRSVVLALTAGVVLWACAAQPRTAGVSNPRLLPALGAPQNVRLPRGAHAVGEDLHTGGGKDQTRPAISLHPGETRECDAELPPEARLHFAVALENPPAKSVLALEVKVDGTVVHVERIPAEEGAEWHRVKLALPKLERARIGFRGEYRMPDGTTAVAANGPEPRVLLGSPRLVWPRPGAPRRVLVWISQDTVRADHIGTYGYARATSPNFDRLAKDWAVFDDAMAPASWTLPSLASQITSRYPSYHGAVLDSLARDTRQPTLFEVLAAQGFTVLGVTGNRFLSADFRMAAGFDALWFTPAGARDVTAAAVAALHEAGSGDLALFVHYMDPHYTYEPPPPYDRFDVGYQGHIDGRNFRAVRARDASPADVAHVAALYDGELAFTDEHIGVLLRELDRRGLLDQAVIVYSADHGEGFLEHGKWMHTLTLYRELLHVPLAIRVPGLPAKRIQTPVSLVDVAPTILEAFGVERPRSFQGRSLLPLLRGASLPPESLFAETEQTSGLETHKVALRRASTKYILIAKRWDGPTEVLKEEAYDVVRDPGEQSPLTRSPEIDALRREAVAFLDRARREGSVGTRTLLPADVREALRAVGYLE